MDATPTVTTEVWDPGTPSPSYDAICTWPDARQHKWQLASVSQTESVWICTGCMRIVHRKVEREH